MRAPRILVGVLSALVGALFLLVHLQLHPVPYSAHELRHDPPRGGEVLLTSDNAIVLGERDEDVRIVAIDQGSDFAIQVARPFEPGPAYTSCCVYVFDAAWPDEPRWEMRTYRMQDVEVDVPTLVNVVWEADRAQQMPPPWLAGAGVALLALGLVAIAPPFAWAGAAAALGFAASHASAQTPFLAPRLAVWALGWLCLLAAAALLLGAAMRRPWRAHLATAAALAAFGLGAWAERAMLAGYRPFTGIL